MRDLARAFAAGIMPDPTITHAQWAEQYFILPPSATSKGLINLSRIPYAIEPLENMSWSSPVQKEFTMKGVQIAWSTISDIILNSTVDCFPCPVIMYFGSDSMAIEYVKTRLEPAFEDNPRLAGKIRDGYDKKSKSTHGLKIFPGGVFKFCGGITEKNYRQFSAAMVIFNDIDSFPRDIGGTEKRKGQGSPIDLGVARTNGRQGKFKIFCEGSPTDEETSIIYEEFKKTDQRYYFVVCPFCEQKQIIDFFRIRPNPANDSKKELDPHLECDSCNKLIPETKKHWMMQPENGAGWIATRETNNPLTVGRQISSAYSLLGYPWKTMYHDFLSATRAKDRGNIRPMVTFWNTKLGLPWKNQQSKKKTISHTALYKAREKYIDVPAAAAILTASVDVQNNRLEVLVVGHTETDEVYGIEHKIIGGNTLIKYGQPGSPYNDLLEYLQRTFKNEFGKQQPILHSAIDMGFRSITASDFLKKVVDQLEITAVYGGSTKNKKKLFVGPPIENKYGFPQRELNVDEGKTMIHNKLALGLIHFNEHPSFTDDFFRQLTAESFDDEKQVWTCADHVRNEATDLMNYNLAAIEIYAAGEEIDWQSFINWNETGCNIDSGDDTTIISSGIDV